MFWGRERKAKNFPRGFLWGSATSAYQVEGGNKNSDWEHWRVRAGRACDHYNRFEEDFEIAKSLNQNAHRFSIEWARIEPEKGKFEEKEVEHYREVLGALRRRKIKPLVTLHHFTNPLWLAQRGGWENPDTVGHFESYVRFIVTQLSDLCDFWLTINEPAVHIQKGYWEGGGPPGERSLIKSYRVARNMLRGHREAYRIIHRIQPQAQVSMAYVLGYLRSPVPVGFDPIRILEQFFISQAKVQDFVGVNYYRAVGRVNDLPKSDMGWAIYPQGLYANLMDVKKRFNLPIYITENGIADADDDQRANYITDHLVAVKRALEEGADIRGYFYWSLLDNFEWEDGYDPRFGLVEVDYQTMKRTVRPSARVYARIAKANSL